MVVPGGERASAGVPGGLVPAVAAVAKIDQDGGCPIGKLLERDRDRTGELTSLVVDCRLR